MEKIAKRKVSAIYSCINRRRQWPHAQALVYGPVVGVVARRFGGFDRGQIMGLS